MVRLSVYGLVSMVVVVVTACAHSPEATAPRVATAAPVRSATSAPPLAAAPATTATTASPPVEPKDAYEALVAKAEAGEPVDFYQMRMAYLESPVFPRERGDSDEITALHDRMFKAMHDRQPEVVFDVAEQTLKRLYIDLDAQKGRRQSCTILGRPGCARFKEIELGLLRSVVRGRDGKSCPTAWKVVSIPEEYFVLRMIDLKPTRQSLVTEGNVCDQIDVVDEHGTPKTIYFDVGAMLDASELAHHPK
jgi:hypothetical protein